MLDRIFLAIIIIVLSIGCGTALGYYKRWRLGYKTINDLISEDLRINNPTLLYFWTSECSQCRPQEICIEKAVDELQQSGITLNVLKYHALESMQLSKHLRLMTVPTTILLGVNGRVVAWNAGLVGEKKIVEQYMKEIDLSIRSKKVSGVPPERHSRAGKLLTPK